MGRLRVIELGCPFFVRSCMTENKIIPSSKITKDKKPNPKGHDLMLAIAFWIYGLMFFYFPDYAGISKPWAWIFFVIAYFWYAISIIGAVSGIANLTKSEFIKNAGYGFAFGIVAFLLYKWSQGVNVPAWASILLKILGLPFAMFGVAGIAIGIPYLWDHQISSIETPSVQDSQVVMQSKKQNLSK